MGKEKVKIRAHRVMIRAKVETKFREKVEEQAHPGL
jgi:hypothetical protein